MLKSLQVLMGTCLVAWMLFAPVAKADSPGHGRDCATAAQIGLNTENQGTLTDTEDRAVYRIVLNQRGLFEVWTEAGNLDIGQTELLDSFCKAVQGVSGGVSLMTGNYSDVAVPNSDSALFPNSAWTLAPGVYFVAFVADPMLVSGRPFIFHNRFIEHSGHDCSTAVTVELPASIESALLFPEDRQVFRVSLPVPAQIHFWTTGSLPPGPAPFIDSRFSDCSSAFELEKDDETGAGLITDFLEVGTYYFVVEPYTPDSFGPFTLHIEVVHAGEPVSAGVQVYARFRPNTVVNEAWREVPASPVSNVPSFVMNLNPSNDGRTAGTIRIGRLELTRKADSNLDSDNATRFDLADMFRTALQLGPKPAITVSFDLHWIEP